MRVIFFFFALGSNVDKDLITSLLSTGELEEETQKEGFFSVCKAHVEAELPSTSTSPREVEDHRYHVQRSDSKLIYYVCGYVAKKCVLPSGCSACISLLLLTAEQGRRLAASALVLHNDRGGLVYPAIDLFRFITRLEEVFTGCFSTRKVHRESVLDILHMIHRASPIKIGCSEHTEVLTPRVISFYLTMRLHFFVKGLNKSKLQAKRNSAKYLKLSRLH